MKVHVLKTWPAFFEALVSGKKTFDIRRNDRGFEVGDILILRQWNPASEDYMKGVVGRRVTYMASEAFLPEGFCCMSIEPLSVEGWQEAVAALLTCAGIT